MTLFFQHTNWSSGPQREPHKNAQTKKKKKLTCCQKCCRRIRRRICRRIKRCLKKKIFGSPDPHLDDYDLAGYNLGSIRDMLKINKDKLQNKGLALDNKNSIVTLFRSKNMKSFRNAVIDEMDRYSLMGFDNKWSLSGIKDFRERSLFKNIQSKFNLSKEKFSKLYTNLNKDSKLLHRLSATVLKKKFSVTGSKEAILNRMLDDYKKGKLNLSDLKKGSKLDFENLDKEKFHKVLQDYEDKQQTKVINDFLKRSVVDLQKKFSISRSQQEVLKKLKADYKKNKLSLTFFKNMPKLDLDNIDKDQFRKIIKSYKDKLKKQKVKFAPESKLEQIRTLVKSNLFDRFSKP